MTVLTEDDLLEVVRSSVDEAYLEGLENEDDGQGFDLYRSIAAIFARASEAVDVSTQEMYAQPHSSQTNDPASGGVRATGTLSIERSAPTDGDIVLEEGEIILIMAYSPDGTILTEAEVEVSSDTTFAAGVSGPLAVPVRSVRVGYHANLEPSERRTAAFFQRTTKTLSNMTTVAPNLVTDNGDDDTFGAGDAGGWLRFTSGPNVGTGPRIIVGVNESTDTATIDGATLVASAANDGEIVDLESLGFVANLTSGLSGGRNPTLDTIGSDRSMGRGINESDDSYRNRIKYLPDTISYNALYRAASRMLTPLGIPFRLIESRDLDDIVGASWGQFAWDDPEAYNGIVNRDQFFWQGNGFQYRGFYLVVERQGYGDFGAPFGTKPGVHPSNAWDHMFYDGFAIGWYNDMENVVAEIEKTRGGGVPWLVVIVDEIP
jgi:hypothetical protein